MADSTEGFLTPTASPLPVDAGLLERFLDAEHGVEWRPVDSLPTRTRSRPAGLPRAGAKARANARARWAYYHDETARIEQRSRGSTEVMTVTSGPVGALVLVGECCRRGLPTTLEARTATEVVGFPEGAIEARWDGNARSRHHVLPFADVVKLARYALA